MNYIIQTGGKQYLVKKGDIIDIEKVDSEVGKKVNFDLIMTIDDKEAIDLGAPLLAKTVEAEVLKQFRGEKLRIFKMKRRKRYRRSQGHRQSLTQVQIGDIK